MDNRNYDGILWHKHKNGYWHSGTHGLQHVYVWQQAHQATVDKGDVIHHIDGNPENNDIENLCLMEKVEHARMHMLGNLHSKGVIHSFETRKKMSNTHRLLPPSARNNRSGFKGVSFNRSKKKWTAFITVNKKGKYLGRFDSAEEAAHAYDTAARKYFGSDCFQNFSQDNLDNKEAV